jgi:hypothetical protein
MVMRRLVVLCALLVAACGTSSAEPGPVFDDEGGTELTCLKHQAAPPGARYSEEGMRNSAEVLNLLRYYTANGRKSYCDGAGASADDKAWGELYVKLGADHTNVASIVD